MVSPSGRLGVLETEHEGSESPAHALTSITPRQRSLILEGFQKSSAEGLFALGTLKFSGALPPAFDYWREFAAGYLTRLCQTTIEGGGNQLAPLTPPTSAELGSLVFSMPPMRGAEYVSASVLESLWQELDEFVRGEVARYPTLADFLKERAPLWHQVGRVCFHLAENKRDPEHPFAFLATYAPKLGISGKVQYQPLSQALKEYAGEKNKQGLVHLLSPVERASKHSPFIKEMVETRAIFQPLAWKPAEAYRFLKDVPLLEDSGVLVRLPDWWKKRPRPRVGITIGEQRRKTLDFDSMLDFRVGLALGDQELTEAEWRELMAAEDGLVLLKGQWVEVDREKLKEALEHWKKVEQESHEGLSFVEGMRLLAGAPADLNAGQDGLELEHEWSFVNAGSWLEELLEQLRSPESLGKAAVDKSLKATLRPYQDVGVNWLSLVSGLGLGACLADDMGLGKTIQVLGLLLGQKNAKTKTGKPSLLVLPASLIANWKAEMERFAPTLRAKFVHLSQATKEELKAWEANPHEAFSETDVVLTTYGMLLRQKWLSDVSWRFVILDEAQAIKNPGTRQTKAVKKLKAEARIALTGTPVENRLGDLWSLFDFLCPGLLGSQTRFKQFIKAAQ